ncbi:hypothetical protein HMPREF2822_08385 [Corynebacterium sp. HMSC062E11]|uniref:hypothetical protein n=1 Tax=unclassified Corynebacterium TaxID=2624378 RepID=UPI0008A2E071|nr:MULTISPECIES: hypothetical protein [unclassified Corynebacterium]MDK6806347.1 hypothetical protein [Corynebacterium aurimucosum]NJJ83435.1 hypothetical protein [Corynebacterium aurimucosum]OFK29038.1 hypothetical protein HMPREF2822_08385 [Corynebacterium sp. HMSC062E11]OFP70744.1 hypothetical protein HMPREF2974_02840 [Corynebacterium sp. HMSC078C09]
MPFVLLSLAALALAAGLIVLWLDQRQRAAHSAGDAATDTLTDTGASADVIATDSADGAAEAVAPEAAEPEPAEPEATAEAYPEPEAEPVLAEEPEPTVEPAIASEPETTPEPEAEPAVEASAEPAPAHSFAERAERARHLVPGSARRERKAFGQQRGWEYIKHDSYLADEWTRGAAARGQEPRDIVAGSVRGHETLLFDIGAIPVMAMRTGAASDVVVDFRRAGEEAENHSEDLVYVREEEGFEVFATDAGVGQRLIDARVTDALSRLPAAVTAVWMEGEWVLAQTTRQARSAEWEALLEPLSLLADSARVLPPRSEAAQVLRVDELDPSRDIPEPPQPEPTGPTAVPDRDDSLDTPTIQRPTEPVVMPSRTTSEARGTIDHSSLGADEVDAIADGHEHPAPENNQARLPRRFDGGSSIFD